MMIAGIEREISSLAQLNPRKRRVELVFFPLLWFSGAALTLFALGLTNPFLRYPAYLTGLLLSAIALNGFVLLVHEGMHGLLFRGYAANRWTGILLSACVLMSFTAYKVMHLRHHRYLGDPRDPDDYDNYTRSPRVVWLLHFMRLTIGSYLYILMIPILASRHGRRTHRRRILAEYAVLLALWTAVLVLVPLPVLLHIWVIPVVMVAAMTGIRGFTQHGITDAHDPFLASRSIHPSRIMSFLLMHENLHLEHHLFPEIPSYHLARVHELIAPRLPRAVTGRSYLAFIWKFLRLSFRTGQAPIVGLTVQESPEPPPPCT